MRPNGRKFFVLKGRRRHEMEPRNHLKAFELATSFPLSMNSGSACVPPARRARMQEPAAETAALPGNRWWFKGSMREDWFRRIPTPAPPLRRGGNFVAVSER